MTRWIFALTALVACDTASPPPAPSGAASGSLPAAPASASATATTTASARAAAPAGAPRRFAGSIDVKQAKVKVQSGVKVGAWRKDEGKELVGACEVDLVLAGDGSVSGTAKGALGELVVTGAWDGKLVHAEIASKDPAAEGAVRGTLEATLEGDALGGKLRIASSDASLVREADVALKPKS
jgi:hypothetical protein